MMVIQPSGAVTTVPHGYAMAGQQAVYVPQQVAAHVFSPFNHYECSISFVVTY